MKKFLIGLVLFFVIVIAAAVILIPHFVNVERYRGRIEAAIRQKTGLEPSLGAITLKLLPSPALRIQPLGLKDPKGRAELGGADLSIRAELKPLLHRRLVIQRIEILHPRVTLTRKDGVLALPALPAQPEAAPSAVGRESGVQVDHIEIRNGSIIVAAGAGQPAWGLSGISMELSPKAGTFGGRGALNAGGKLSWTGAIGKNVAVTLEHIPSTALEPWLPAGLVHSGEIRSGTVTVSGSSSLDARLELANLTMLSGTKPLSHASADLTVGRRGDAWRLDKLTLAAGGATIHGAGNLTPALNLVFKAEDTPIEGVLNTARAAFPVPLTVKSPGTFAGSLRLAQREGSPVTMTAWGTVSAASVAFAPGMPALENVRTRFAFGANGSLVLSPLEANVVGGALAGHAVMTRLDPPSTLRWTGTLRGANLSQALATFSPGAAAKITGTGDLDAAVTLDLSRSKLDARALSGTVSIVAHDLVVPGWDIVGALHDLGSGKSSLVDILTKLSGGSGAKTSGSGTAKAVGAFTLAKATANLTRIPWRLSRIVLQSEDLSAHGGGTFDPMAGTVDLDLTARLSRAVTKRLVSRAGVLKNLRNAQGQLVIPMTISGPTDAPKIAFDLGRAFNHTTSAKKKRGGKTELIQNLVNGLLKKR